MKTVPISAALTTAVLLAAIGLSACQGVFVSPENPVQQGEQLGSNEGVRRKATASPTEQENSAPTQTPAPVATATAEPSPTEPAEPEINLNPLTGLPVDEPKALCTPPLLVAVSNFPPSARPQSGLSAASHVWETFIGEGMTRFLAVFYGDYRGYLQDVLDNRLAQGGDGGFVIGPVRSGRVVFEDIKSLFPKGILITAGASQAVMQNLSNRSSVYAQDPEDINSAGVDPADLPSASGCAVDPGMYGALTFSPQPPQDGSQAEFVRVVYNLFNQVGWEYDPERGAYLRYQDQADGTGELVPAEEGLTGEQLAFENVLVLWAQHRFVTPTIIEMEIVYVKDRYGLLLRDGQVQEVRWSTPGGRLMVHDENGAPIALKPGSTFFEVVSYQSTWDSEQGVVRYHNPPQSP